MARYAWRFTKRFLAWYLQKRRRERNVEVSQPYCRLAPVFPGSIQHAITGRPVNFDGDFFVKYKFMKRSDTGGEFIFASQNPSNEYGFNTYVTGDWLNGNGELRIFPDITIATNFSKDVLYSMEFYYESGNLRVVSNGVEIYNNPEVMPVGINDSNRTYFGTRPAFGFFFDGLFFDYEDSNDDKYPMNERDGTIMFNTGSGPDGTYPEGNSMVREELCFDKDGNLIPNLYVNPSFSGGDDNIAAGVVGTAPNGHGFNFDTTDFVNNRNGSVTINTTGDLGRRNLTYALETNNPDLIVGATYRLEYQVQVSGSGPVLGIQNVTGLNVTSTDNSGTGTVFIEFDVLNSTFSGRIRVGCGPTTDSNNTITISRPKLTLINKPEGTPFVDGGDFVDGAAWVD